MFEEIRKTLRDLALLAVVMIIIVVVALVGTTRCEPETKQLDKLSQDN